MQLLIGEIGKSVTVQHILNFTNSMCYVYYEQPLMFNSYYINSDETSIEQLRGYIEDQMKENEKLDTHYDYFILYTNNTKEEIQELIDWLNKNNHRLNALCLMVTCRP